MANVHHASAADVAYYATVDRLRENDPECLWPPMAARVASAIADATAEGFDVERFETCRSRELAELYFQRGVSKAPTEEHSYHGMGLAVDVISLARNWNVYPSASGDGGDPVWVAGVCASFRAYGLAWGGDWTTFKDWPHWQPAGLPAMVPFAFISAYRRGGRPAVWAIAQQRLQWGV
jgi:hypothetical protein